MKRITSFVIIGAIGALAACSHLTVAPKRTEAAQIEFCDNYQDAGIVDAGASGVLVRPCWVRKYDDLLKRYGAKLNPPRKKGDREGIKAEGDLFRVTYEVSDRFGLMKSDLRSNISP